MTQGLSSSAFELSGIWAVLLLLFPFIVLAAVIWRAVRGREPEAAASRAQRAAAAATVEAPDVPLEARIARARDAGDDGVLAGLYLAQAREASSAGDLARATKLLREAVGCAQRSGNVPAHADARLDLAEIARAAGDLTTACEHWQMARKLFLDLKRKDRLAEADALMLKHGCPTDWVLTDF